MISWRDKETKIVSRLAEGKEPKQIAAEMSVKYSSLKSQLNKMRHKVGANNQAHLVAIYLKSGKI